MFLIVKGTDPIGFSLILVSDFLFSLLLEPGSLFSFSLTIFFPLRRSLISVAVRVSNSSSPFAIMCRSLSLALIIFFAVASPF